MEGADRSRQGGSGGSPQLAARVSEVHYRPIRQGSTGGRSGDRDVAIGNRGGPGLGRLAWARGRRILAMPARRALGTPGGLEGPTKSGPADGARLGPSLGHGNPRGLLRSAPSRIADDPVRDSVEECQTGRTKAKPAMNSESILQFQLAAGVFADGARTSAIGSCIAPEHKRRGVLGLSRI